MPRSLAHILILVFAAVVSGCTPPELTAPQQELVSRCLELAHKQERSSECEQVTEPMEKAYLEKHPEFYEKLLSERKTFVEGRIAEDRRQSEELSLCIDQRADGNSGSPACKKFTAREIARASEDRRRRACAEAQLDGKSDASQRCKGLSDREIADEVQAERVRRESRG